MSLTFLTPLMLAGAALVAAPIVLHLIMRQQPKHLVFPALRFIRQRNDANKRRLRLRHLLLLLLRCAAILFLALALARPSLQATGFLGDQEAPVAAALVFDTSPRMNYRHQNQTRLEVAQQAALQVLKQLPPESEVAVMNSRTTIGDASLDAAVAGRRVSRLTVAPALQSLPDLCIDAMQLVTKSAKGRKEVYVFTDLSRAAWSAEATAGLQKRLAETPDVALYVIDVGVDQPRNFALGDLRLAADTLSKNTPLRVETELLGIGAGEERSVAIDLIDPAGQPQRRAQRANTASPDVPQPIEFQLAALEQGTHQGIVRIVGEDSLPDDDVRYFTIEVRPAWKVLIVGSGASDPHADRLAEALAPDAFRRSGQARFECEIASFDDLTKPAGPALDDYAAVCLLDPPPLADAQWQSLTTYVERGGGLGIWLGPNAQPKGRSLDDFNTTAAQRAMPGKLQRVWRRQDAFLAPQDYQHPLLAKFRSLAGSVPWEEFPVESHWQLSDLADGVDTVIPYSNGQPALVEKAVGKGRVLLFTTPIAAVASDPDLWNLLTVGSGHWPFVMLSNEMLLYLVGSGEERLNYTNDEAVAIRLPEAERQLIFSLRTPAGEELSQSVEQATGAIAVSNTSAVGNYWLRSGGTEGGVRRGFSVNLPAESTDLTRLAPDEFATLLGKDRFRLSRGQEEIERDVSLGRTGREIYPFLILLVAVVLGLEHLLANKFHRRDVQVDQPPRIDIAALAAETLETGRPKQETVTAA